MLQESDEIPLAGGREYVPAWGDLDLYGLQIEKSAEAIPSLILEVV